LIMQHMLPPFCRDEFRQDDRDDLVRRFVLDL
jgi:hypothetical protein